MQFFMLKLVLPGAALKPLAPLERTLPSFFDFFEHFVHALILRVYPKLIHMFSIPLT
jgi:hypothetical protein